MNLNNNVLYQMYLLVGVLILTIFFSIFYFMDHNKNYEKLIQNKENSLIKDFILADILSNKKDQMIKRDIHTILNGGNISQKIKNNLYPSNESYTFKTFYIDKNNIKFDFLLSSFLNKDRLSNNDKNQIKITIKNIILSNTNYHTRIIKNIESLKNKNIIFFWSYFTIAFILIIGIVYFIFKRTIINLKKVSSLNEELKNLNLNLENNIHLKTRELREINNGLMEKVALEVDNNREKDKCLIVQSRYVALGDMINNISEQLLNPLNILKESLTKISENIKKEEINYYKLKVAEKIREMNEIVSSFQELYSNEDGNNQFNLKILVDSIQTLIGSKLEKENINIIYDIEKDLILNVSKNDIIQVLINLISNSTDLFIERKIDFKSITISFYKIENGIGIEYEDSAGGVHKNFINKIFKPYFTTKKSSNSTGLGLYISEIIISKKYKGSIKVHNIRNGVLFSILIPN